MTCRSEFIIRPMGGREGRARLQKSLVGCKDRLDGPGSAEVPPITASKQTCEVKVEYSLGEPIGPGSGLESACWHEQMFTSGNCCCSFVALERCCVSAGMYLWKLCDLRRTDRHTCL